MKGTWFVRLYRADKRLFTIFILFFGLTLFANAIRLQTTPFFIWQVYSQPMTNEDDQYFFEVHFNEHEALQLSHTWQEPRKQMLLSTLAAWYSIETNGGRDAFQDYLTGYWLPKHPAFSPALAARLYPSAHEIEAFPGWYKRFLSAQVGEPVYNIVVTRNHIHFNTDASITAVGADTVLTIP